MRFIKKGLLGFVFLLATKLVSAQGFVLEGHIAGLPDGTDVELLEAATIEKVIASNTVRGGKFELKASTDIPKQFRVRPKNHLHLFSFLAENGDKITVTGNAELANNTYTISNVKIKGSPSQQQFEKLTAFKKVQDSIYQANLAKYDYLYKQMSKAREANNSEAQKALLESTEWKAMEKDERDFFALVEKNVNDAIDANRDSWWGPLLALNLYGHFPPDSQHIYEQLSDEAKQSYYGQVLKELVLPEGFVGKQSPAVDAKDLQGNALDLASIAKGKKIIMIDFWASWCVPCRNKIPELKEVYAKYKDQGLEIVGISIDRKPGDWEKALKEENLPYPNYLDVGSTGTNWKVRAIPAMFILDQNGKVIAEEIELSKIGEFLK